MKRIKIIFTALIIISLNSISFGQNQNMSNGTTFDGEPYLAINPSNSQHIVIAWMGYKLLNKITIKTRVSYDAGNTWSIINSLPHINSTYQSADPSLAFDNLGNIFVTYINHNKAIDSGKVVLRKSTDGGLNWGNAVEVIDFHADPTKYPVDRPWIAVDKSGGTNNGNIYVTTMPPGSFGYIPPRYHPYFMVSKNNGISFLPYKYLDTTNWLSGDLIQSPMPSPSVSSDGIFYAVYPSYMPSQSPFARYILASSSNGGNDFSYKTVYSSTSSGISDTLPKKAYLLRTNPANANHLALFYVDDTHGDIDIFIRETFNKGTTWSSALRVNDDPIGNNKMQDMVWADFDSDGDLIVSWRDRRNASDSVYGTSTEMYAAFRTNGATSFSTNFKISDNSAAHQTIINGAGNDFMCVNIVDDTLSAVWGSVASGKLNIWFQRFTKTGVLLSTKNISSENSPTISIFPNPTADEFKVTGKNISSINIYNSNGKLIFKIENKNNIQKFKFNLKKYQSGIYIVNINTVKGIVTKKIVKK